MYVGDRDTFNDVFCQACGHIAGRETLNTDGLCEDCRPVSKIAETNDPHGEHDFGSIQLDGCLKVFWKIDDYSDASMDSGADDKLNAYRVLVIMLADEY